MRSRSGGRLRASARKARRTVRARQLVDGGSERALKPLVRPGYAELETRRGADRRAPSPRYRGRNG